MKSLFFNFCVINIDSVMEQYPIIDKILAIHKSFKSILFGKDSEKLGLTISMCFRS